MDTNNEQMSLFEDDTIEHVEETKDDFQTAVEDVLSKIRRQGMLLGAQVMLQSILDKITAFERTPGSKTNNDHKRLIKDIKAFCTIGLSRKVNADGETESITETVQN